MAECQQLKKKIALPSSELIELTYSECTYSTIFQKNLMKNQNSITNKLVSISKMRNILKLQFIQMKRKRYCNILQDAEKQSNDHLLRQYLIIKLIYYKGRVTFNNLQIIQKQLSLISMILLKAFLPLNWFQVLLTAILKNMLISPYTQKENYRQLFINFDFVHLLLTPKIMSQL